MRLVLNSSVAIKWVLPEKDTPKAVRLRNEFRRGLHELLAPDVFPVEVSHALTRAERRGVIRPPAAINRLNNVLSYPPVLYPTGWSRRADTVVIPGVRSCHAAGVDVLRDHARRAGLAQGGDEGRATLFLIADRFEGPCEPPSQGPGIGPKGSDRRVGKLARLQLADRRTVDPRPLGHISEAQPLLLAFASQAGQGLDQLRIPNRRVFLSIGFDVPRQLRLILGSLALGTTRLNGGLLLGGQLGSPSRRLRRSSGFLEDWLRMN